MNPDRRAMLPSRSFVVLLTLGLLALAESVLGETYECTVQKYGRDNHDYCVFSQVKIAKDATNVAFKGPAGQKHTHVVFENSEMDHLPADFLLKFGANMKVLNVSSSKLRSVVITDALEELYAIDNYIEQVIVHQSPASSKMQEMYLQSNRLKDITNITRACKNVRILDLSRNQQLAQDSEIDLSMFDGFNKLEYLMLADVGAFYVANKANVSLPTLRLLDISMNSLQAKNFHPEQLSQLQALEILRLNDNEMKQLNYEELASLKLKEIYLEGNLFDCDFLREMFTFFQNHDIVLKIARTAGGCDPGYHVQHGMCCKAERTPASSEESGQDSDGLDQHNHNHSHSSERDSMSTAKPETIPASSVTPATKAPPSMVKASPSSATLLMKSFNLIAGGAVLTAILAMI